MKSKFSQFNKWWKAIICILLAICTYCVHRFASPQFIENYYGQGVFPVVRFVQNLVFSWLPFSGILLLLLGLLFLIARAIRKLTRKKDWQNLLRNLVCFFCLGYSLFYFLWAFNYDRPTLSQRLGWADVSISNQEFIDFTSDRLDTLNHLRSTIDADQLDFKMLAKQNLSIASKIAQEFGYVKGGRLRCRQLSPKGLLMRFSTAGFYFPYTGECNIDSGLHPLEKPSVVSHEIFHGLGVAGEGDCNFLAFLACNQADNTLIRYSGELDLWYYLMRDLRQIEPEKIDGLRSKLSADVVQDFEAIRANNRKYPDIMPGVRDAVYNSYLKSNKIATGIHDYNRITKMVLQANALGLL